MGMTSKLKTILLASSSAILLAACTNAEIESPGDTGSVTLGDDGGGGGADPGNFVPAGGCPTGTSQRTVGSLTACALAGGTITSDLNLPAGTYAIDGAVFIGGDNADSATLTLNPGTTLFGASGNDFIVISRGSRINAQGTASSPIVMTSLNDLADGSVNDASSNGDGDANGEWGGLIISGNAPINDCNDAGATGGTVGCVKFGEGNSGLFGGSDAADDSGDLRFVRVQYAGFRVNDEDELNGIAFQGVGNSGDFEFLQIHNNLDDGVEFFGGAADVRNLVITGAGDDSIDWTDGWTGSVQFAAVVQSELRGDRGIEADNRNGDNDITPRSDPTIANFTFIGGAAGDTGMVLRRGAAGDYVNGIITNWQDAGIDIDDQATFNQVQSDGLRFFSLLLAGNNENIESGNEVDTNGDDVNDAPDGFAAGAQARFDTAGRNNVEAAGVTLQEGLFPGPTEDAVTPTNASTLDSALVNTDYIGAFPSGTTGTSASNWAAGWTIGLPFQQSQGCPAGTTESSDPAPAGRSESRICILTASGGPITSDITLTIGNLYELQGAVFIGNDNADSTTLTINPGVTVFGSEGNDFIVIARGSQIQSLGTEAAPVVLTSRADVEGTNSGDERGQWGGLVLSGNAPINDCNDAGATGGTVGCVKFGEGNSGLFGGADPDDDSGDIFFTRVQYAGFRVNDEDELNGIAFQGIGGGGEYDFIQVHNNLDDGVEFFGGAANVRHLVITGAGDDSIDWTDGWVGNMQYAIVVQQSDGGDRGIEADNRNGDNDITPRSAPDLANFTFIGGDGDVGFGSGFGDTGILPRRGTGGRFINGILANWADAAIDVDDAATEALLASEALDFQSIYAVDNNELIETGDEVDTDNDGGNDSPDGFAPATQAAFDQPGANNVDGDSLGQSSTLAAGADDGGVAARLVPGANEGPGNITPMNPASVDSFFEAADYVGAVEDDSDNWYVGWTFGL